jgi:hypothetical protein
MQYYCGTCKARNGCEHVIYINYTENHAANDNYFNFIIIFGIPHNFTNWLALLLQVDSLERPSFT